MNEIKNENATTKLSFKYYNNNNISFIITFFISSGFFFLNFELNMINQKFIIYIDKKNKPNTFYILNIFCITTIKELYKIVYT